MPVEASNMRSGVSRVGKRACTMPPGLVYCEEEKKFCCRSRPAEAQGQRRTALCQAGVVDIGGVTVWNIEQMGQRVAVA